MHKLIKKTEDSDKRSAVEQRADIGDRKRHHFGWIVAMTIDMARAVCVARVYAAV